MHEGLRKDQDFSDDGWLPDREEFIEYYEQSRFLTPEERELFYYVSEAIHSYGAIREWGSGVRYNLIRSIVGLIGYSSLVKEAKSADNYRQALETLRTMQGQTIPVYNDEFVPVRHILDVVKPLLNQDSVTLATTVTAATDESERGRQEGIGGSV